MNYQYDDGGRKVAGFRGNAGDCVCRAVAIATGKSYQEVYSALNDLAKFERKGRRKRGVSSARSGVYRRTTDKYMKSLGWKWVPTMFIGSGCKVHLREEELPTGRLVVTLSGHVCAVVDGVIHDIYDPSREGTRCVYGYWYDGLQRIS